MRPICFLRQHRQQAFKRSKQGISVIRLRYGHQSFHVDVLVDLRESYLPFLSFSFSICKRCIIKVQMVTNKHICENFAASGSQVKVICCYCLVTKLYPTLCDPMDCSIPGFPVLHYLPEIVQIHVIELVMLSNHIILCHHLLLLPSVFPNFRIFSNESFFASGGQNIGASASASVLPMNIQG